MKIVLLFFSLLIIIAFPSCDNNSDSNHPSPYKVLKPEDKGSKIEKEAKKRVKLHISSTKKENGKDIKYTVYLYDKRFSKTILNPETMSEDNEILHSKYEVLSLLIKKPTLINIEVAKSINKLLVLKNDQGVISSLIINLKSRSKKNIVYAHFKDLDNKDIIYSKFGYTRGYNTEGKYITIDLPPTRIDNHNTEDLVPGQIAIDSENRLKYISTCKAPYYLIKHNLDSDKYELIGKGMGINFGGLSYNTIDKHLYGSYIEIHPANKGGNECTRLAKINPNNGEIVKTWLLLYHSKTPGNFGDIAFDKDGKLFLGFYAGLFEVPDIMNNNSEKIDLIRIGHNFSSIESMAFGFNGKLYAALGANHKYAFGTLNVNTSEFTAIKNASIISTDMAIFHGDMAK